LDRVLRGLWVCQSGSRLVVSLCRLCPPADHGLGERTLEGLPLVHSLFVVRAFRFLPWVVTTFATVAAADLHVVFLVWAGASVMVPCTVSTCWLCSARGLCVTPSVASK